MTLLHAVNCADCLAGRQLENLPLYSVDVEGPKYPSPDEAFPDVEKAAEKLAYKNFLDYGDNAETYAGMADQWARSEALVASLSGMQAGPSQEPPEPEQDENIEED